MSRGLATNLAITALALAIFAALHLRTGRVEANEGLGWDGRQYAHMVTGGLKDGTGSTQTRPLLPLLTRIPFKAGLELLPAFQLMNFLYAAALCLFLCLIFDRQGVAPAYKTYFVVTVSLCIATSKMFAFYPTLIDLGALAVLTASTLVVLTRTGWSTGAAAILAVTAREFGGALALFGFHRDLRRGRGFVLSLLIYAPAVVAVFLLRFWSRATNVGDRDRPLATFNEVVAGFASALDPVFISFFVYFMATLLGGITVLLVMRPLWSIRQLRSSPELATFALPVVAAAAVGPDIWRYGVFLLPVLALLFAAYVREHQPGVALLAAAFLVTVVTQQPFVRMDMVQYFRDWFPVYLYQAGDANDAFWSTWQVRFVLTGILAIAIGFLQWFARRHARSEDPVPATT
jgi:hypothetical protein